MKAIFDKIIGFLAGWAGDGPWCSQSVLAALAAVVVGLGFWCSDLKNNPPPNEVGNPAASTPGVAPSDTVKPSTGSHWTWSKPFPFYVRLGASYVAGFCIGWFFRKLTRLIMVVVALIIALLAYGKPAGCDTSHAREQVKRGGAWVQQGTTTAENYLKHMLPSATTGGVGIFLGFRRRNKPGVSGPAGPAVKERPE